MANEFKSGIYQPTIHHDFWTQNSFRYSFSVISDTSPFSSYHLAISSHLRWCSPNPVLCAGDAAAGSHSAAPRISQVLPRVPTPLPRRLQHRWHRGNWWADCPGFASRGGMGSGQSAAEMDAVGLVDPWCPQGLSFGKSWMMLDGLTSQNLCYFNFGWFLWQTLPAHGWKCWNLFVFGGYPNLWPSKHLENIFHKCVKFIMVFSSISSCPTCLKPVPQFGHPNLLFLPSQEPERPGLERFVLPVASPRSSPSSAASASRGSAARVGRTTSLPRCPTKASRCSPATRPGAQGIPREANYETDKNRNYWPIHIIMGAILIQSSNIYRIIKKTLLTWRLRVRGWVKALDAFCRHSWSCKP